MSNNIDNASNIGEPNVADKSVDLEAKPRKEKSPPALSVYLGSAEESARRMKTLDDIAERLNLRGRSTLIQWIADGRLQLVVPFTRYEGPEQESNASFRDLGALISKLAAKSEKPGQIFWKTPEIAEEQKAEIRRYIEDNIDSFAENEHGWHKDMMSAIMEKFHFPDRNIYLVWDLIQEEAKRHSLYPNNISKRGKTVP